jgi:hypothetical protein
LANIPRRHSERSRGIAARRGAVGDRGGDTPVFIPGAAAADAPRLLRRIGSSQRGDEEQIESPRGPSVVVIAREVLAKRLHASRVQPERVLRPWRAAPPRPEGEGRGEGERRERPRPPLHIPAEAGEPRLRWKPGYEGIGAPGVPDPRTEVRGFGRRPVARCFGACLPIAGPSTLSRDTQVLPSRDGPRVVGGEQVRLLAQS